MVGISSSGVASSGFSFGWLPTGNAAFGAAHVLPPGELLDDIHVATPIAGRIQSWAAK